MRGVVYLGLDLREGFADPSFASFAVVEVGEGHSYFGHSVAFEDRLSCDLFPPAKVGVLEGGGTADEESDLCDRFAT